MTAGCAQVTMEENFNVTDNLPRKANTIVSTLLSDFNLVSMAKQVNGTKVDILTLLCSKSP